MFLGSAFAFGRCSPREGEEELVYAETIRRSNAFSPELCCSFSPGEGDDDGATSQCCIKRVNTISE